MIFELILALILGIIAGTFTGLSPGIHINLVSSLLVLSLGAFSSLPLISLAVFIVSMSIAHTFLDFIPSIYLGAPEDDTFLAILPGHEMLQKGEGHTAVMITLIGSLFALPFVVLLSPLFIYFLPAVYSSIKSLMPFILIFLSFYIIFRDDDFILGFIVFSLAGFLGYVTLNLPINESLMPLLTGLFGTSSLIVSLQSKTPKIRKQKLSKFRFSILSRKEYLEASAASLLSAPIFSILPGISSGHSATFGSELIPQSRKGFLFMSGAINTLIMSLSYVTLYAINKSRSGTSVAISNILPKLTQSDLVIILSAIVLSGILSFIIGIFLSRYLSLVFNKINYKKLTLFVLLFLFALNFIFSGWLGLVVLITSTSLGIFAIESSSRRINLMGALIVPTIIYFLFG